MFIKIIIFLPFVTRNFTMLLVQPHGEGTLMTPLLLLLGMTSWLALLPIFLPCLVREKSYHGGTCLKSLSMPEYGLLLLPRSEVIPRVKHPWEKKRRCHIQHMLTWQPFVLLNAWKCFHHPFSNLFLKHPLCCRDFACTSIPAWIGET